MKSKSSFDAIDSMYGEMSKPNVHVISLIRNLNSEILALSDLSIQMSSLQQHIYISFKPFQVQSRNCPILHQFLYCSLHI